MWATDNFRHLFDPNSALSAELSKLLLKARPVRATYFAKSSKDNWSIGWHQDRVIAVKARGEAKGFVNWTKKSGVWHCEPPKRFLDNSIFIRIFLDNETAERGAMQFLPQSHPTKIEGQNAIDECLSELESETTEANRGDVFVAKMTLLHKSLPSRMETPRRVLRIDFCNQDLPPELDWALTT